VKKTKKLMDIGTNELASFLGKTPGFASQLKYGRCKLPPKDCQRVALRFNIPLYELRPDIYPQPKKAVKL
jgi:DNA-binding transcriptional regulator YdaS (Cro superfamily)